MDELRNPIQVAAPTTAAFAAAADHFAYASADVPSALAVAPTHATATAGGCDANAGGWRMTSSWLIPIVSLFLV